MLSGAYISLGDGAINPCGSSFSSSYVSVGNGIIGSSGCGGSGSWSGSINALSGGLEILDGVAVAYVQAVPDPETYGLWLVGLGVMGFMARLRKQVTA